MSDNNWETQPRKENGEFTYRYEFWKKKLQAMDKMNSNPEVSKKYDGGSYYSLYKKTKGNNDVQIHHTPADSISPLSTNKGPCVIMDKNDHAKTASYKGGTSARLYRDKQKELIQQGHFLSAEILDFSNLIELFGDKYTKAMLEKLEYDKQLYTRGEINE